MDTPKQPEIQGEINMVERFLRDKLMQLEQEYSQADKEKRQITPKLIFNYKNNQWEKSKKYLNYLARRKENKVKSNFLKYLIQAIEENEAL